MRPLRIQYPGAYYHVTCRGNERRKIFLDAQDHKIFLEKLSRSLDIYNVSLLTYVCMQNHFHLLVTTPDGNLSEVMRHFNISYTSAFNRRHSRVGHLYQGRYKAFRGGKGGGKGGKGVKSFSLTNDPVLLTED